MLRSPSLLALALLGALVAAPVRAAAADPYAGLLDAIEKIEPRTPVAPPAPPAAAIQVAALEQIPVLQAQDLATALAAAAHRPGPGAVVVRGSDGQAMAGFASAAYPPSADPTMALRNRQAAILRAWLGAKAELAKAVSGLSVTGRTTLLTAMLSVTDDDGTRSRHVQATAQRVEESTAAVLAGLVTWSVQDDPAAGSVRVTVASLPASRRLAERDGGLLVSAPTAAAGLELVLREIRTGVVPPVGARAVQIAGGSGVALVGYGSQVVAPSANPELARRLGDAAAKQAELLALDALVGALNGDLTSAAATMDGETRAVADEFTATPAERLAGVKTRISHRSELTEAAQSLRSGRLPPEVRTLRWTSDNGRIAWAAALIAPPTDGPVATPAPVAVPPLAAPAAGLPDWVANRPADAEFLYGVGTGAGPSAIALSTAAARLDLGQQISAAVSGGALTRAETQTVTETDGTTVQVRDLLVGDVRIRVDERTYRGAEIIAQTTVGGTVYTLVRMPRAMGAQRLSERLAELDARLADLPFGKTTPAARRRLMRAVTDHHERSGVARALAVLGQPAPASTIPPGAFEKELGRLADGSIIGYRGESEGPARDAVLQVIRDWGLSLAPDVDGDARLALRVQSTPVHRMVDGWHRVELSVRVEILVDGGVAGQLKAVGAGDSSESREIAIDRAMEALAPKLQPQLETRLWDLLSGTGK